MDSRELTSLLSSFGTWPGTGESCLMDFNEDCLRSALQARLSALALATPAQWLLEAQRDPRELENLHRACFNPTSAFFRDAWSFCLLEQTVIPELLAHGPLRIWSAGCSGGQEAYSLAILLEELEPSRPSSGRSTIVASDADPEAFDSASTDGYPETQLQGLSVGRLRRWFVSLRQGYTPIPELRARVHFTRHDLLDREAFSPPEAVFGGFDLICCANVLIYYTVNAQARILENLHRALSDDGRLLVGPTEVGIVNRSNLFSACCDGPVFRCTPGVP